MSSEDYLSRINTAPRYIFDNCIYSKNNPPSIGDIVLIEYESMSGNFSLTEVKKIDKIGTVKTELGVNFSTKYDFISTKKFGNKYLRLYSFGLAKKRIDLYEQEKIEQTKKNKLAELSNAVKNLDAIRDCELICELLNRVRND